MPSYPASEVPCLKCKHLIKDKKRFYCLAFPEGIPTNILNGNNKHSKPLPEQDNDIVFEPIEEK